MSAFRTKLLSNCGNRTFFRRNEGIATATFRNSRRENGDLAWKTAKQFHEIPMPLSLPVIGTTWPLIIGRYRLDRQHEANAKKFKTFGPIMREKFGPLEAVVCFTAEDAQRVLWLEGPHPFRIELETIKVYRESRKELFSTGGLLVLNGKEWRELRFKTQKHLLRPDAILAYLDSMQDVTREFVERMRALRNENKEIPNFLQELYKFGLESVALVGLDTRLGCFQPDLRPDSDGWRMIQSVLTQFECMNQLEIFSGNFPFWKYFTTPTWKKFVKASDVFARISSKYIKQSLENISEDENKKLTLLQAMLSKEELSVGDAMVFVGDMLLAGVETTSHTNGFLLYHLAKNKDKQEKLYQEIKTFLPNKEDKITSTIYYQLRYLKACFKESMRLTPTFGGIARKLAKDAVLSGYQVPAGTHVFIQNACVLKDEKHFKNPDKYLPERWLVDKEDRPDPFAFLPFGFGPRSCVGRRLAELEINCLIVEIIRNFRIEYHFEDIGYLTKMTFTPDKPLKYNFIERSET